MSYVRDGKLGAVPVAAAAVAAKTIFPNLFAGNTSKLNDQRVEQNKQLEIRAIQGDTAALAQLQTRAQPGVLPYKVATDDARVRVANVIAARAAKSNQTQSGVPSVVQSALSGMKLGNLGSGPLLASLGFIALAFILKDRR